MLLTTAPAVAQVGIGTASPNAAAALEVSSPANNQGFLPPRLTYAQRTGISNAVAGLLVYQSNDNASPAAPRGYYYYSGSGWLPLQTQGDNLGNHTATQNLNLNGNQLTGGTSNNVGLVAGTTLELGNGVSGGKEANAGKIGYNAFGSGALDIVGAGTSGSNRKIKLWGEGGTEINGPLKVAGGGPGAGKVLTSDADGDATWQVPGVSAASNGLTASSGTVKLGGTLSENTVVGAGSGFSLRLETPVPSGGTSNVSFVGPSQTTNNAEAQIRDDAAGSTPVAQTFIADFSGTVSEVYVLVRDIIGTLNSNNTTTLRLELLNGTAGPTGGFLISTTTATFVASGSQHLVELPCGSTLIAGNTYTLRLSVPTEAHNAQQVYWRAASGNIYTNGASSAGGGLDQYFTIRTVPGLPYSGGLRLRNGAVEATGEMRAYGDINSEGNLYARGEIVANGNLVGANGNFNGDVNANNLNVDRVNTGTLFASNLPFGDYKNVQWNQATGQFFYDNSSRRYKVKIQPLQTDFGRVLQLTPVTYERAHTPGRRELGFIAEQADSLGLKPLVEYDAQGRPDGFNYEKMVVYLTALLAEERRARLGLEARLARLEALAPTAAAGPAGAK